jgi:hypothetical protein
VLQHTCPSPAFTSLQRLSKALTFVNTRTQHYSPVHSAVCHSNHFSSFGGSSWDGPQSQLIIGLSSVEYEEQKGPY